jgi:hypothetical protein
MEAATQRNGRARKDCGMRIGAALMVHTRFPRMKYPEIVEAAATAGMPVSTWIRALVFKEIASQKRKSK